ncbi:glutamate-5-semialdehyde dehydrogenase [Anaerosalibacter bizertensis]|uniref:Gamma-glutamyl phosphate reductase n=1 Tax=Anaerosalibacter bizertensis TaxID=932217 RepID=A0A9Q4AAC8_9FIRM|nr:glutamate-5-semialdehyde dehydrogenase [Anaerosalibacter bizertensis]MBV1816496.1 glutamate-5-semialdehyde dehydrogenase [Bacteroidales bacterium MSK.15.36]MCG4563885.1 glutamate-5-semialdehyde dehydrogenase [Anaerosalibacter bizertensis]MCG4581473.1 glutamate-5-semialdehyde dehydrogenase [Anaerosalibacter bizertensis]
MTYISDKGRRLRKVETELSTASTEDKNRALKKVIESLENHRKDILESNALDIELAEKNNMKAGLIDRLKLDNIRLDGIIESIDTVIKLQDPIWKSDKVWTIENGLTISRMTVPLGVIGIIYESRPNVTVDAFSLALKSGNCIMLRGSSSAIHSNKALVNAIKEGLRASNISEDVVQFIEEKDRQYVNDMLKANEYLDLIIPRGGKELIDFVVENSSVPTLQTGVGNCHIFVDESADIKKALNIVNNAKTQRIGVCNACETLLVHEAIADEFLPMLYNKFKDTVEIRGCTKTREIIEAKEAKESDWKEEFLDYIIAVKVVKDINEAIDHIGIYGSKHSEAIVTENFTNSKIFLRKVDASTVYVNASTRFTDGGEFGFGAEMGISTQKTHARGPVGLEQLVIYKYLVIGDGQIRK